MNRIAIYVIYDYENTIDKYILEVLKEIRKYVKCLVVVCNFHILKSDEDIISMYSDRIIIRDNDGYDAGAYRDALINYITWDYLMDYDELLLLNDSFFGPIYPFEKMFLTMERDDNDFWGITSSTPGRLIDGYEYEAHVQSYFLNFKSRVLHNQDFFLFWKNYIPSSDRLTTIKRFEIGINRYLNNRGYKGKAYSDMHGFSFMNQLSINPYIMYSYELISEGKIPIIKIYSLLFDNVGFLNAIRAKDYIMNNTDYDIRLIDEHINRMEKTKKGLTVYDFKKMEEFVKNHSKIYVYGYGNWARKITLYFEYKEWTIDGYIVTNKTDAETNVRELSEMVFEADDGIIIAQKYKENCEAILKILTSKCDKTQVFMPKYG